VKPKIKPSGLDIGGTSGKPLDSGSGRMEAMGEGPLRRLGGAGTRIHEGWAVWHPKPKIDALGLNISGAARKLHTDGSEALLEAGERPLEGPGA
jgi:hypothetical protein